MNNLYWEKFETSGEISDYISFKNEEAMECSAMQGEDLFATDDYNNGACATSNENRGE